MKKSTNNWIKKYANGGDPNQPFHPIINPTGFKKINHLTSKSPRLKNPSYVKKIESSMIDKYANDFLKKTESLAEKNKINEGEHNGPLDAIRHAAAAAGISSNIFPSWTNYIPSMNISKILVSNALGAAHELKNLNNFKETASDLYNNFIGSIIGSLNISDDKKQNLIIDAQKKGVLSNIYSADDIKKIEELQNLKTSKSLKNKKAYGGWLSKYQDGGPDEKVPFPYPIPASSYRPNPYSDEYYKERMQKNLGEAKNFLKDWYTKRQDIPEFKDVSERRVKLLEKDLPIDNADYKYLSQRNIVGEYLPEEKKLLLLNTQKPYNPGWPDYHSEQEYNEHFAQSTGSPVLLHEMAHYLQYEAPENKSSSLTPYPFKKSKDEFVSEEESGLPRKAYNYFALKGFSPNKRTKLQSTYPNIKNKAVAFHPEMESVLAMFREAEKPDPRKKITADEMKGMMDKYSKYADQEAKEDITPEEMEQFHKNYLIGNMFKMFGNDPEKAANYYNSRAAVKQKPKDVAKYGGDISIPDLDTNSWIMKYAKGGPGFLGIGKGGRGISCPGNVCDSDGGGGLGLGKFLGNVGEGVVEGVKAIGEGIGSLFGGIGTGRRRARKCEERGMEFDMETKKCKPKEEEDYSWMDTWNRVNSLYGSSGGGGSRNIPPPSTKPEEISETVGPVTDEGIVWNYNPVIRSQATPNPMDQYDMFNINPGGDLYNQTLKYAKRGGPGPKKKYAFEERNKPNYSSDKQMVALPMQRDAVAAEIAKVDEMRRKQGEIKSAGPRRSAASKAWAIASNPITALAYKAKGQDIPENFERGERNLYDMATDVLNPATYLNAAERTFDNLTSPKEMFYRTLNSIEGDDNMLDVVGDALVTAAIPGIAKSAFKTADKFSRVGRQLESIKLEGEAQGLSPYEIAKKQMEEVGITSSQREAYRPILSNFAEKYIRPYGYEGMAGKSKLRETIDLIRSGGNKYIEPILDNENIYSRLSKGVTPERADAWRLYLGKPQKYNTFRLAETAPVNHPSYTPEQLAKMDIYSINTPNAKRNIIPEVTNNRYMSDPEFKEHLRMLTNKVTTDKGNQIMGGYNKRLNQYGLEYNDIWDLEPSITPRNLLPRSLKNSRIGESRLFMNREVSPEGMVYSDPKSFKLPPAHKFLGKPFMSHEVLPYTSRDLTEQVKRALDDQIGTMRASGLEVSMKPRFDRMTEYRKKLEDYPKQKKGGWLDKYDQGGPNYPKPTAADSLVVYNSALANKAYYDRLQKKGVYKQPTVSKYERWNNKLEQREVPWIQNINQKSLENMMKNVQSRGLESQRNILNKKGSVLARSLFESIWLENNPGKTHSDYISSVGKTLAGIKKGGVDNPYRYYYKDLSPSVIDPDAPFVTIDTRITPQNYIRYDYDPRFNKNLPASGAWAETLQYDPLAVKPYAMRTPAEKIEWEKRYNPTGYNSKTQTPVKQKRRIVDTLTPVMKEVKYKKSERKPKPVAKKNVEPSQKLVENIVPVEQPVQQTRPAPVAPQMNYNQGIPVYAPVPTGGGGALVGFRTNQGNVTYIKPEDYERMGVPKYGREYIEQQNKKYGGSVNNNWINKYK